MIRTETKAADFSTTCKMPPPWSSPPPRTAMAATASGSDHYARLLQICQTAANPGAGRAIHARAVKAGLLVSAYLCNNLLSYYAGPGGSGGFPDARRLFDEIPAARRNVFTWNTLLSMFAKSGRLADARAMFAQMPDRDAVSWTVMVVGLNRVGQFGEAVKTFLDMVVDGLAPTQFTLTNVLSSCAATEARGVGRNVHSFIVKLGQSSCVPAANSVLNMYGKCGDAETARAVFERMRVRSVSSWNAMVSLHAHLGRKDGPFCVDVREHARLEHRLMERVVAGYNQNRFDAKALRFFSQMLSDSSMVPDEFTITTSPVSYQLALTLAW